MKLTNNVICRMTMSRSCTEADDEAKEVRHLVEQTEELMGRFNLSDYVPFCKHFNSHGFDKQLEGVHRRFDNMMEAILEEKENSVGDNGEVKDILDILLEISKDPKSEVKLTRENIKGFILDMFAAGTETSAITMEWALAELIRHPEVIYKARAEIERVVGKSRVVEEADIGNLPYLEAVVKETLRLHPAGPMILRQSSEDCRVGGYEIPARTTVFVNVWAVGRDAEEWTEPLEFKPERFVGSGVDYRGQHYQMLPFGSGRRSCPGTALAMLVIVPALGAMIQCFEWEVSGGGSVDMEEGPGLTMPRAKPLMCMVVPRLDPMPWLELIS